MRLKANCKVRSEQIDGEIAYSGMSCRQRYLKQFDSTAEQQSHQQEPGQSEAIADSKHPGDEPKGCKVLKDLPDAGDRALVRRDNRQHKNCGNAEPSQRARNSPILRVRPSRPGAQSASQRRSVRRENDVSTIVPDASNTNIRLPPEATTAKGRRVSKGLKLIILIILTARLLVSFAWIGFLSWTVGTIVAGW
jgi:hypothetical protein